MRTQALCAMWERVLVPKLQKARPVFFQYRETLPHYMTIDRSIWQPYVTHSPMTSFHEATKPHQVGRGISNQSGPTLIARKTYSTISGTCVCVIGHASLSFPDCFKLNSPSVLSQVQRLQQNRDSSEHSPF